MRREFFPCGQGVGAIHELVPAGELVARMVVEAEAVLDRLARLPQPLRGRHRTDLQSGRGSRSCCRRRLRRRTWDDDILPTLHDYIRIPNVSPAFDAAWAEHGHMAAAVELIRAWCAAPARRRAWRSRSTSSPAARRSS